MINISYFANAIRNNVPEILQVIQPQRIAASNVDTSALLTQQLAPICDNRVYPYKLPDNPEYPSMTYEQTGFDYHELDGYTFTRNDAFIIAIQSQYLGELIEKSHALEQAATAYAPSGAAGGMEITNKAVRWHDTLKRYEMGVEIAITHLALASQAVPVFYLYPLLEKASENRVTGACSQLVTTHLVGLLIAPMPTLGITELTPLLNKIRQQILGQRNPLERNEVAELAEAKEVGKVGSLVFWREVYTITTPIYYP